MSVSKIEHLSEAAFFVNEGDKIFRDYPILFEQLMNIGQTRRFAYDCYSHALLAMGHVDIVIDYGLQPYDYLPLVAVIEEAEGVISDWQGRPLTMNSDGRVISAATPLLHAELLAIVHAA